MEQALRERRGQLERNWQVGVAEGSLSVPARPDVLSSWQRSSRSVRADVTSAPVATPEDISRSWAESRLGRASRVILDDLTELADSGDMMAALTDDSVTIAWIAGGRTMSRRAEGVHFMLGGCWAEDAVGTNALALAHQTILPATVFSAEHYAPMVHDWVCYSAPILDPESGCFLGVIDLSTVWQRAHSSYLTTVSALARCVEYELATGDGLGRPPRRGVTPSLGPASLGPPSSGQAPRGMVLQTLGSPSLQVEGVIVPVTRRQLELLTVLSLHPAGLNLDELTGCVYGDHMVSQSTVKAELSHLRHLLGGRIGSRPYRLVGPVAADHGQVVDALATGDVSTAVALYRGPMLAFSDSPEITNWRHHIDAAVRDAVLQARQPEQLLALGARCREDIEVHEATLDALDRGDSRRSIVAGRLAAAQTT